MIKPQMESTTTLARDHKAVFDKLVNGPVFLSTRSKPMAVVLSVSDYERIATELEELKRFRRIIQADRSFAEMSAGSYVELSPNEIIALGK